MSQLDCIEERITSLRAEIKSYGADIVQHISVLYSCNTTGQIDLKNDPRNILKMLKEDVKQLLVDSQELAEYSERHKEDIEACSSLTKNLEAVSAASIALESAEEAVMSNDLRHACDVLSKMWDLIDALPKDNTEIGAGEVCQVLRHSSSLIQSQFHARLRRLIGQAIRVDLGKIQVFKQIRGGFQGDDFIGNFDEGGIQLQDIWHALLNTKEGENTIERITLQVWINVVLPLWREKKLPHPSIVVDSNIETGMNPTSELKFEFASCNVREGKYLPSDDSINVGLLEHCPCRMKFAQLLEAINHVMGFVYSQVFLCNDEIVSICHDYLNGDQISFYPKLCGTLLAMLPKSETDLIAFQSSIKSPCREFEQKMNLYGFLSSDEARGERGPLTNVVQTLHAEFLSSRRTEILAKARRLVLSDYHNTMLGTGDALEDDPSTAGNIGDRQALLEQSGSSAFSPFLAFRFESCQISLACCRLLKLMHEVLKQAIAGSSASLALMLYRTSRDCLELFQGVVQSKYSDSIESVARMGAVFFNDCAYISHNVTLLTHMYRQDLGKVSPELTEVVGFIDFIPRFRAAGEKCLGGHIEAQKRTLRDLVAAIRIKAGDDDSDEESTAEKASNDAEAALRVLNHLQRLQGQWQHILQDSAYDRIMGYLLEYVIRGVMQPVFEAKYISEVAASDISKTFRILQKAGSLFEDPLPAAPASTTGSQSSSQQLSTAANQIPQSNGEESAAVTGGLVSWAKFCALTDLLEFTLSDISEWLPKRKFVTFTGPEMSSLIRALFEDSPRRQQLLTSILEMSS